MKKNNVIYSFIIILIFILLIAGATYAYYSFQGANKNILFNTSKNLENYIVYNEGESKFIGDLKVSNTYTEGIHSTISLYKTSEATNVDLIATINMDINSIGENIQNSSALKWTVTSGTSSNVISTLASGDFVGADDGDTMTLVTNIPVTTTEAFYTIWIWLDASENPEDNLTGETLDTTVWTRIDQAEGNIEIFEITRSTVNYQKITATVENTKSKIVKYAVTTSNTEPASEEWIEIPATVQGNSYTIRYNAAAAGRYYLWVMDEAGKTMSSSAEVTQIDSTAPVCTWGTFSKNKIAEGETATINLTCTDSESDIISSNLTVNDFTTTDSTTLSVSDITKTSTTNGYQYTVTVTGGANSANATLKLLSSKIKNAAQLGNNEVISNSLEVTYKLGTITISKTIQHYETSNPVTFVYSVDAVKNSQTIYSDIVSITQETAGTKTTSLNDVPIGANITVREVYNGRWYTLSTPDTVNITLTDQNNSQTASFTADYNYQGFGGGIGKMTNFSYDTQSGWSATGEDDNFDSSTQGTITISKTLNAFSTRTGAESTTFNYKVNALYKNTLVYSKSIALTFNQTGTQTLVLNDVPLGTDVYVYENYRFRLYHLNTDNLQVTKLTSTNTSQTVSFTGEFYGKDYDIYGGYGTLSTYNYTSQNIWNKN